MTIAIERWRDICLLSTCSCALKSIIILNISADTHILLCYFHTRMHARAPKRTSNICAHISAVRPSGPLQLNANEDDSSSDEEDDYLGGGGGEATVWTRGGGTSTVGLQSKAGADDNDDDGFEDF